MDKLRAIDYCMKVAECGSIATAALALDLTPSAVSKVIASLEEEVGFALFQRTTRNLSLTTDGAAYLERCRQILRDLQEAESERRPKHDALAGTVKVGMHPAFRNPFFAEIGELMYRFPKLRIETRMSNSPDVLFDEGFDLLIRAGEPPESRLVARRIGWLDFVVVASPRYLERYGEPKTPADLERHRWLLPRRVDTYLGSSPHWVFSNGKETCAVMVDSYLTVRDSIGAPESVTGGAGIACLYTIGVMMPVREGLAKPLLTDWKTEGRPVFAVFANKRAITPKTLLIVDFFSELLARAAKQFPHDSPGAGA